MKVGDKVTLASGAVGEVMSTYTVWGPGSEVLIIGERRQDAPGITHHVWAKSLRPTTESRHV